MSKHRLGYRVPDAKCPEHDTWYVVVESESGYHQCPVCMHQMIMLNNKILNSKQIQIEKLRKELDEQRAAGRQGRENSEEGGR